MQSGDVKFVHLAMRRHKSIAKVAMGRRLAIRLYWMWRNGREYSQSLEFGSYAGQLETGHGVQVWVPSPENRDRDDCSGTVIGWCRCARES